MLVEQRLNCRGGGQPPTRRFDIRPPLARRLEDLSRRVIAAHGVHCYLHLETVS